MRGEFPARQTAVSQLQEGDQLQANHQDVFVVYGGASNAVKCALCFGCEYDIFDKSKGTVDRNRENDIVLGILDRFVLVLIRYSAMPSFWAK